MHTVRRALLALLAFYDYNPATGRARLITRGAKAVKGSGPVTFELFPQDYRVRAGNRLGLLLAGNDKDFYLTAHSGRTVSVKAGSLSLPVLGAARTEFLTSAKATPAMGSVPSIPVAAETVAANTVEAPGLG